jgi:hypothetical protein
MALPLRDTDTTYFGIPYKKRYIKRAIGKPEMYFIWGQLYAIDKDGNEEAKICAKVSGCQQFHSEHIPFLSF